jgi:hypothetical protein
LAPADVNGEGVTPISSYDGNDLFVHLTEFPPQGSGAQTRTYIKKITDGPMMTDIAGPPATAVYGAPHLVEALSVSGNNAGSPSSSPAGTSPFQVVNQHMYVLESTSLFSADPGGTWVKQTDIPVGSFAVDRYTNNIYFFSTQNKTQLIRKPFLLGGRGGTETVVADFAGSLTAPVILAAVPTVGSHRLYIADGNSIYVFYNPTVVP